MTAQREKSMLLSDYIVNVDSTILQTMEKIDKNSKGMVYIVADRKLQGVVTDGDIRRYLLQQGDLKENVLVVANICPLTLKLD